MTTTGRAERGEGYERFFGLTEAPFSLAPNPRFLFESASHAFALAQVAYALERREPLVVITGDIGTGKTLLCRTVLQRLERKTFLSIVTDPLLERDDLLKQLLQDFGVISKDRTRLTAASRHELSRALQAFLTSLAPIQAHAVVIIDEAQHLQPDVLEQIRLLSNIDDQHGTMLQIILVGQTDLEPLLSRPELRQFQQRVTRRFRLKPLDAAEVQQYIEHRLALARGGQASSRAPGAKELERAMAEWEDTQAHTPAGVEFTPDAIQAVSKLSGGLPRVINLVCDRSLEAAYVGRQRTIDLPVIQTATRSLGLSEQTAPTEVPFTDAVPVPAFTNAVPTGVQALTRQAVTARLKSHPVLAASLVAAAMAIWLGVRAVRSPATPVLPSTAAAPASDGSTAASTRGVPVPVPEPAPVGTPPSVSGREVTRTPARPGDTAPVPGGAEAATTGELFEILVASFRTESRATSAADQIAALGLPVRRRVNDGWQQVIAGPFASRAQAEDAQRRLDQGGLTGTRIGSTAR